jgi:hypothetical protein
MKVGCKCTNEACGFRSTRERPVDTAPCARCGAVVSECGTRGRRPGDTCAPLAERFWRHVDRNGPVPTHVPHLGPCWLWTANLNPRGYGRIRIGKEHGHRQRGSHVVSYELAHGPVPEGMEVAHRCDRPSCVRPSHLTLATHAGNLADMRAKGRAHYQQAKKCGATRLDGTPCQAPGKHCRWHKPKARAA